MELEIKGFIETSFLDWDGKIVSTVFVPYCDFNCPFCHNYGLVEDPKQYETVPVEKIEAFLKEHKDFIDGICLTGGEPCLHKDKGLFEFLKKIKAAGFQIKIDTNGNDPETLKKIIEGKLADYIAMDIKGPLNEKYEKLSGVKIDISKIKSSIKLIRESGIPYEFRTTVVPTLLDIKDIEDIAKEIKGARKFILQQFVAKNTRSEELREVQPYDKAQLEEMIQAARSYVKDTVLRGA